MTSYTERGMGAGEGQFVERVVSIRRVAKVVAGGRRFSFTALVVVGDQNGQVGIGYGKGREIPDAVRKATTMARKRLITVPLARRSIPHEVTAVFSGSRVLLKPAAPGTGVIAGSSARAVLEAAGINDVLTKSLGSRNPINVVKAAFKGLQMLRDPKAVAAERRRSAQQAPVKAARG